MHGHEITRLGPAGSYTSYGLHWANASNTPFTLYKTWTNEGGIATPLIAHWPGRIANRGGFTDAVVHVMDVAATFLDAAGTRHPEIFRGRRLAGIEGRSFLPTLLGQSQGNREELAWSLYGNKAIRRGNWKLVRRDPAHLTSSFQRWRYPPALPNGQWELYDLSVDRTESRDLSVSLPERVRELATPYAAWSQRVHVPKNPGAKSDGR